MATSGSCSRCSASSAENLEDGSVAVYNSTALEDQADVVNGILRLAIETFHIAADGTNV